MKLRLRYFRKYTDISFDLGTHVTKITGESGSGKSTILDAIFWCLYGKIQKVGTREGNSTISGKTEVTIEMPYYLEDKASIIQIHRTGQKSVQVIIGDSQFTGETAQAKIDEYFLPHMLFTMTSYMRAEMSHPLLTATPIKKRELTTYLFPDASKYDLYKKKLLEIRRNDEASLSQVSTKITSAESSISTIEETYPWIKDAEGLINPTQDEKSLIEQVQSLQKKKEQVQRMVTTYKSLKKQLSNIPPSIDVSPLELEASGIKGKLLQSIVDSRTKENKVKFMQSRLDDSNKALGTLLTAIGQQVLDMQECSRIMSVCDELLSMASSVTELDTKIKDTSEEYSKESTLLLAYEKSLEDIEYNSKLEDVLICPCCKNKLQHIGNLVIFDGDTAHRPIEHNITPGDIQKQRLNVDKLDKKKNVLKKQFNRYQDILSREDTRSKGVSLRNLDLKSYKSKLHEYARLFKEKELIEKELKHIQEDSREYITSEEKAKLESRLKELNTQITTYAGNEMQRVSLTTQIGELTNKNTIEGFSLDDPSTYISTLDIQIHDKQKDLEAVRSAKEKARIQKIYLQHKSILVKHKEGYDMHTKRIDTSHKAEVLLASAYNEYVGIKLKELEYDVCLLGKTFFDDTMNITLLPGEESSTGVVKPSFDVQVEYGNILYDDIDVMSTGERKRLSIIFLIVLTKYLNGKILLLDEALYSVGLDTRGIIMNEMSKLGIPVYLTSHDEVVGITNELRLDEVK